MSGVTDAISSVAQAVGGVAATVATYGPNDSKKAVSAAKKAGKEAQKLEEAKYPSWDAGGTRKMAKEMGYKSRAEWKRARAEAGQTAYQEAYDEVWAMYQQQVDASINHQQTVDAQTELAIQTQATLGVNRMSSNDIVAKSASGCLGFASLLLLSGAGIVSIILSLIC